ncbi:MAG TPA: hypothetical protein VJ826_06775, partial [Candidatus Polarisedimenticolaceae bacterium]|nr:hypothetical protein [Candidatus Polarisedimenticolaceae bacterium]
APLALADEVVQFTNGAEMTVRSHAIEKDMVKLDLGGNSSITFPISMVDKITSAGQNVFLNPVYHPSNQALPPAPNDLPSPLPDRAIRGGGVPVGYRLGQTKTGTGLRMGEVTNDPGDTPYGGTGRVPVVSDERTDNFTTPRPRRFNPLSPQTPGTKQVIDPPSGGPLNIKPSGIQIRVGDTSPAGAGAPPADQGSQPPQEAPPSDNEQPPAQDPPESH